MLKHSQVYCGVLNLLLGMTDGAYLICYVGSLRGSLVSKLRSLPYTILYLTSRMEKRAGGPSLTEAVLMMEGLQHFMRNSDNIVSADLAKVCSHYLGRTRAIMLCAKRCFYTMAYAPEREPYRGTPMKVQGWWTL